MSRGITFVGLERLIDGDVERLLDVARMADEFGVAHLVQPEHLVVGDNTGRYPYGEYPVPPEHPWPEPITMFAAIAAVTQRIRLATGILIAPLRTAPLLAKSAATLDVLSKGRVDLGLGAGWQREEFDASGLPFDDRYTRLTDIVAACRRLWTGGPVSFRSATVRFDDIWCYPTPRQAGGPPLFFGGPPRGENARRIAAYGKGWLPVGRPDQDALAASLDEFHTEMSRLGRAPDDVEVRVTLSPRRDRRGRPDLDATLEYGHKVSAMGASAVTVPVGVFAESFGRIEGLLRSIGDR